MNVNNFFIFHFIFIFITSTSEPGNILKVCLKYLEAKTFSFEHSIHWKWGSQFVVASVCAIIFRAFWQTAYERWFV